MPVHNPPWGTLTAIDVSAGETVYVRVSPSFLGNGEMQYRIASSFVG